MFYFHSYITLKGLSSTGTVTVNSYIYFVSSLFPLQLTVSLVFCYPVYSPDMPKRLPVKDILGGLLSSIGKAVRYWFHYTLVAFAWLGVVPLTACKFMCAKYQFIVDDKIIGGHR